MTKIVKLRIIEYIKLFFLSYLFYYINHNYNHKIVIVMILVIIVILIVMIFFFVYFKVKHKPGKYIINLKILLVLLKKLI